MVMKMKRSMLYFNKKNKAEALFFLFVQRLFPATVAIFFDFHFSRVRALITGGDVIFFTAHGAL